jgi:hypothetical protein
MKTKLRGLSPRANYTERPGFDSRRYQIFWEVVGLERGPLSHVTTIEELLERKSSGSGLGSREYGSRDPSLWPRGSLYLQTLTLTWPISGYRSVSIVRSQTKAAELSPYHILLSALLILSHTYILNILFPCFAVVVSDTLHNYYVLCYPQGSEHCNDYTVKCGWYISVKYANSMSASTVAGNFYSIF